MLHDLIERKWSSKIIAEKLLLLKGFDKFLGLILYSCEDKISYLIFYVDSPALVTIFRQSESQVTPRQLHTLPLG